jgi:hypothetical protein
MSLQGTDGVVLVLRDPLGDDGGHDEHDGHAQHVAGVGVQVDDFHVVIVAVPGANVVINIFGDFGECFFGKNLENCTSQFLGNGKS